MYFSAEYIKRHKFTIACLLWLFFWILSDLPADIVAIELPSIFSDNMVLQRDHANWIWGRATPRSQVEICLANKKICTIACGDGSWSARLPVLPAGGPYRLDVLGIRPVHINNIFIGDVWLCSGQSNMFLRLSDVDYTESDIAHAYNPMLRFFELFLDSSAEPLKNTAGCWFKTNPKNAKRFSAIAYHFAREVQSKTNVPIGVIECAVGGSKIKAWISSETLGHSSEKLFPYRDSTLFNGMIAPIVNFGIKGVIWYQGESEVFGARKYKALLSKLIYDWRNHWAQQTVPFIIVQLANFSRPVKSPIESYWAHFREAQYQVAKTTTDVNMVVSIDTGGSDGGLHSPYKRETGHRLASTALATIYKKQIAYQSPYYQSMQISGNVARISFECAEQTLVAKGQAVQGFTISGTDQKFHWAEAKIDENERDILVWSPDVLNPVAVRYAWADNPICNLYSTANLPVVPFRTDSWPCKFENNKTNDYALDLPVINRQSGPQGETVSCWVTKAYFEHPKPPDIVVLGNSKLLGLLGADAYVYDKCIDLAGNYHSSVLEHDLQVLLNIKWQVMICALPAANICEQLNICRKLFSKNHKPRLVVLTFSPQDFIDNHDDVAVDSKLTDISPLLFDQSLRLIRPGEIVIGTDDGYSFNNNAEKYRKIYKNFCEQKLKAHLKCLRSLLSYLARQNIKVVAFNLPVTTSNQKLLPASLWLYFDKQVADICHKNGADWFDLINDWKAFTDGDFIDDVHLNLPGGLKLCRPIALRVADKFHCIDFTELRRREQKMF